MQPARRAEGKTLVATSKQRMGKTRVSKTRVSKTNTRPIAKIGLALAGGGFLGAAYELGALAALAEAIDGLKLNQLDAYVGVSAGSFVAAGLANGISPYQMVRMFVDSDDLETSFDPASLVQPAYRELGIALRSLPKAGWSALRISIRNLPLGLRPTLWRALEEVTPALPTGLVSTELAQAKLAQILSKPGRTDDFRQLRPTLRVVATDIDSGSPIEFGAPGFDHVPISRAVAASSAIPGLFAPIRIDGRHYVDGALNKTLHASVALEAGAQLVFCVNPLVPYSGGSPLAPHRHLGSLLSQSVRTAIRSRMGVGLEKYRINYPNADVLLFEPRADDMQMFQTSIFNIRKRRQLCEHAYQQTRQDLKARAQSLETVLNAHGLGLNHRVLDDGSLTLLRSNSPATSNANPSAIESTLTRLRHTLDDLDRIVQMSRLA